MREWRARNREQYNAYMRDRRRLNALKASDTNKLMDLIISALPKGISGETRDEVLQDLFVHVLSGKSRLSEINKAVKPLVAKFFRDYANRSVRSLDAPMNGAGNVTLSQMLEG